MCPPHSDSRGAHDICRYEAGISYAPGSGG